MAKCADFQSLKKAYFEARKTGKSLSGTTIAKQYMACIKGKSKKSKSKSKSKKSNKTRRSR